MVKIDYNGPMLDTVLRTKLFIPHLRMGLVPRHRLLKQLNQGLQFEHKLTLISAPAGFGKTTLLCEWINEKAEGRRMQDELIPIRPANIAWLSLDEGDNDLARFLAYFVAALNQVEAIEDQIGKSALNLLQSNQQPPIEIVLTSLINDIIIIPQKVIIFLDDYHVIESSQVDKALTFLLDHLPTQMHLVIATRVDPNLPLSRLRAREQLTELRAADLRFTHEEAASFLKQTMGLNLSTGDIAALETRTEGWIVGLQLAAISMRGNQNTTNLIQSFTGSHRLVLDYLIEEVIQQQSEDIQNFLLKTAVLHQLNGPLCDALTGQENGQETLERLDHANLFIVPLDNERLWYRYHHLFADLLRKRLRQIQPDQVLVLNVRASDWYEQNGFIKAAIEHALKAEDYERTTRLINEQADNLWQRGGHAILGQWLPKLPIELIHSRPFLCIYHAWYLFARGQDELARQSLTVVEQHLNADQQPVPDLDSQTKRILTQSEKEQLKGRLAAVRSFVASYEGDVPGMIYHARQALENLPEQDSAWRCISAIVLGDAHGFKGDMTAAYESRLEALNFCRAADEIYYAMLASIKLIITIRAQGDLQQIIEVCQEQLQIAKENGLAQTSLSGLFLAIWGEVLAEFNDLEGAIQQANKALELIDNSIDLVILGWGYTCLMRILFSRGELDEMEETAHKMERIDQKSNVPPWILKQIKIWQIRQWLAQNRLELARHWAAASGLAINGNIDTLPEIDYFAMFDYITLARILVAQEQWDEANQLLQGLLEPAKMGDRTARVIEILNLLALICQAQGHKVEALSGLKQALILAEPKGFCRIFVDEGQPMAQLLLAAVRHGISPDFSRRLLAAFPKGELKQTDSTIPAVEHLTAVDPLSEREFEVLQQIAKGLTNREIAARLFLTLNTVKVHTRNINSKLDVHNRTEAVARARKLGILSD